MPKGQQKPNKRTETMNAWLKGGSKKVTTKRGKDTGAVRTVYDESRKTYVPKVAKGEFEIEGYKPKTYKAGSNVLDREKAATYDEQIKGNRADDPRNWEFHYKEPTRKHYSATKGMTAQERKDDAYKRARMSAEKSARLTGKDVYEVQKIEYETKGIIAGTKQAKTDATARGGPGRFGSTRVAKNVAAAKQASTRKTGSKQKAGGTGDAFSAPQQKKQARIA